MKVSEAITQFKERTGRYDLSDARIVEFLNSGLRILESNFEHKRSIEPYRVDISAGDWEIDVTNLITPDRVEIVNADGIVLLTPKTIKEMRVLYPDDASEDTQATPQFWAPKLTGVAWPQRSSIITAIVGGTVTYDISELRQSLDRYKYEGIHFRPTADGVYTLVLWGKFYTQLTTTDTTEEAGYFAEHHPDLFFAAGKLSLDIIYGNSQGLQDSMNAMRILTYGLKAEHSDWLIAQRGGVTRKGL